MNKTAPNLLLLFGGRSCEHAVSVTSAQSLLAAIPDAPFKIHLIGITQQGQWRWSENAGINGLIKKGIVDPEAGRAVSPDMNESGKFIDLKNGGHCELKVDVVFPLLHGSFGEDGTVQGLLEMLNLPYVGCGVLASANGMDKLFCKQLFAQAQIPQAKYVAIRNSDWHKDAKRLLNQIKHAIKYPLFIKPANMGSSVGIRKAMNQDELESAINHAFEFDLKVLVEESFEACAEIECAVLGNENSEASVVGEIRAGAAFYDYQAKYIEDTSEVIIPAPISETASRRVQELALAAFKAIDGSGLARVDFFVDVKTDKVFINEINTMPGFTPISMYPKLMQASGLPYEQLIAKLVNFALARFENKKELKRSYD